MAGLWTHTYLVTAFFQLVVSSQQGYFQIDFPHEDLHISDIAEASHCDLSKVYSAEEAACNFDGEWCCWYQEGSTAYVKWLLSNSSRTPRVPNPDGDGYLLLEKLQNRNSGTGILWSPKFSLPASYEEMSMQVFCGENSNLELYLHYEDGFGNGNFPLTVGDDDEDICEYEEQWMIRTFKMQKIEEWDTTEGKTLQLVLHGTVEDNPIAVKDILFLVNDTWSTTGETTTQNISSVNTTMSSSSTEGNLNNSTSTTTTSTTYDLSSTTINNNETSNVTSSTSTISEVIVSEDSTTTIESTTTTAHNISTSSEESNESTPSTPKTITSTTQEITTSSPTSSTETTTEIESSTSSLTQSESTLPSSSTSTQAESTTSSLESTTQSENITSSLESTTEIENTTSNLESTTQDENTTSSLQSTTPSENTISSLKSTTQSVRTISSIKSTSEISSSTSSSEATESSTETATTDTEPTFNHSEFETWQEALLGTFALFAIFALAVALINVIKKFKRRRKLWVLRKGNMEPIFVDEGFENIKMKVISVKSLHL